MWIQYQLSNIQDLFIYYNSTYYTKMCFKLIIQSIYLIYGNIKFNIDYILQN